MSIFWALMVGLVFWLAGWAFGFKAFDSFMVLVLFVVMALAWRAVKPFLDRVLNKAT